MMGCRPVTSKSQTVSDESVQKIAQNKLGKDFLCESNTDGTFILCKTIIKEAIQDRLFHFFVLDAGTNEIVHEESMHMGKVRWIATFEIEVETIPEVLDEDMPDNKSIRILNVREIMNSKH